MSTAPSAEAPFADPPLSDERLATPSLSDPPAAGSGPAAVPPRTGRAGDGDGEREGAGTTVGDTGAGGPLRQPGEAGFTGRHGPAHEAEPTALPLADPGALDDLVPDTVLDGARYGSLVLRTASLRGEAARHRGRPRRDALLTARFGTGENALLLVAVARALPPPDADADADADAGTAHGAASDLCHWIGTAVGRSHVRLAEDVRGGRRAALKSGLHRLTDRAYGRLRARATELGLDPVEFTATLRCLLLPADPACRTRVFFGVGGGGLFRLRDGAWRDLEPAAPGGAPATPPGSESSPGVESPSAAESGDGARAGADAGDRLTIDLGALPAAPTVHTDPIVHTDPTVPTGPTVHTDLAEPFRFRASVARPGDTLLLCSAGLAEPLRGDPALAGALAERWVASSPPGLAAFLADVQLPVTGHDGDRTAAAVWDIGTWSAQPRPQAGARTAQ
ncbi:protein phosphatase 2C domain-containing protein [Streptomyces sp. NPDC048639]|uniref:protein phosphatase 2C domain-containing protein n=1 Tax=Streptomyces sp. NPDC048639 TaxID=3365581 RepID=UPI00371F7482